MLKKRTAVHFAISTALALIWLCFIDFMPTLASHHYTEQQLDALASRVGKTYWIKAASEKSPAFVSTPAQNAGSFRMPGNTSFEITELVGREAKDPYYKVKFNSGRDGYIRPEAFLEELNLSIVSVDPKTGDERKQAAAAEEEEQRIAWIQAQPWSPAVKEAAIKRRAVPGMSTEEIRKVVGQPTRVNKARRPQAPVEEQWLYADGSMLVFHNGLLMRVEPSPKRE
ncbi:MAG TPA: hypothetical protein VFU31_13390 [Candidatus Binatia bacterium]|nr:hypothetical protein [Candidatus Binatia bacterium]